MISETTNKKRNAQQVGVILILQRSPYIVSTIGILPLCAILACIRCLWGHSTYVEGLLF